MAELSLNETLLVEVATVRRRGLKKGADAILALADAGAPREPEPKHGVHMTETGFTRIEIGAEGEDVAAIGYRAFWAPLQEEDLTYKHPHGGHAGFLVGGLLEGEAPALELVAAELRELFG
jgi:hypothetical protein